MLHQVISSSGTETGSQEGIPNDELIIYVGGICFEMIMSTSYDKILPIYDNSSRCPKIRCR